MADALTFKYDIPNLDAIVAAFQKAPEIVQPILTKTLAASQALLAKHTGQNVPYKTGNLRGSFEFVQEALKAHWIPRANYALFVEQGTGIYGPSKARIEPTSAKALFWPGADHPVRSIAGMQGRHYMEKILADATPEITSLFGQCLTQINAALAGNINK